MLCKMELICYNKKIVYSLKDGVICSDCGEILKTCFVSGQRMVV